MSDFLIKDENSDRKYFTLLQNILSRIGLTAFERSLYWAIKECAGESGSCTKSYAQLAIMSGMSVTSVKRTLTSLSEKNKILKKPLLKIINRLTDCGDKDTNELVLACLWKDNLNFFKEKRGGVPQTGPGSIKNGRKVPQTGGVRSHRPEGEVPQTYNKEPIKNPYKEEQHQTSFFGNEKEHNIHLQTPSVCSVVVFSCLEKINDVDVSHSEKIKITKKYLNNEQIVIDAVEAVTYPDFIPDTSLLRSLRAALKGKWNHKTFDLNSLENNLKLAKKLENVKHAYQFIALKDSLEIVKGPKSDFVKYQIPENKFLSEVERQAKINIPEIFKIQRIA